MKQRIKMYEYTIDSLDLTIPSLIDSMDNYFVGRPYEGKPDGIYLIGVDKKFTYTYYYYHTWDWQQVFTQAENAIENAIADIVEDVEAPEVTVTSPAEGNELNPGGTYNIEWTATDNYSVASRAIFLSKDGGTSWELIDSTDGNTGTYSWETPTQNFGACKITVCAYDKFSNEGKAESGTFSIGPTKIIYNSNRASKQILFKKTPESFMIFLPFSGNNTVTISDVKGKQITSFTTSSDKLWYTLPTAFSSGMHLVSIRTPEKTIVRRLWFIR
jgi:hypothetical protein